MPASRRVWRTGELGIRKRCRMPTLRKQLVRLDTEPLDGGRTRLTPVIVACSFITSVCPQLCSQISKTLLSCYKLISLELVKLESVCSPNMGGQSGESRPRICHAGPARLSGEPWAVRPTENHPLLVLTLNAQFEALLEQPHDFRTRPLQVIDRIES